MANNNVLGSVSSDSADWSKAWEAVSRLAATHAADFNGIAPARHDPPQNVSDAAMATWDSPATAGQPIVSEEPDQLARDIAEIERASAALRRADPGLEPTLPTASAIPEARKPRSVWLLVGGIWVSTIMVVAGAIKAIVLLLG